MAEPTYVTTPIYYVNDKPHIGHAYTTTVCDVYARFMRLCGRDVFFLTGTDEHGIKVEKSAAERGTTPQQLADANSSEFRSVLSMFGLTNDDFIRTTEPKHIRQVTTLVKRLIHSDDVYLGEYEGWYDEGQEEFIPQARAQDQEFKSTVSGKPLVRMKEANYFFRLSAYQDRLEKLYREQPDFVRPEARRNEMLARLDAGLADIPVSRTSFTWGIPIPGDEKHVLWVWLDALTNYISAIGLLEPDSREYSERAKYWPADYHVIGKEILFFHALFWPAVLMALNLPLPKCIYAHSFWISEGKKMSKTLGNFIDLPAIERYLSTYGLDAWRYYMTTQGPLSAQDADFSATHFHDVYTNDLVNTVGNCASRVTAMIEKYFEGKVPAPNGQQIAGHDWPALTHAAVERATKAMERFELERAIDEAIGLIRKVDGFINQTEPYKLAKQPEKRDELGTILYQCAETLRIASLLLWGVMPNAMEQLWSALGLAVKPGIPGAGGGDELQTLAKWGGLAPGNAIRKVALFPRVAEAISMEGQKA
jgi:methionyl-tRNA synthetase